MKFPKRLYTTEEIEAVKELIDKGYKHRLTTKGSPEFKQRVSQALKLVKTAGYYEFLRTYIKQIIEIDGLTQLRETEVAIWANKFAVENPVDAASLLIQKASQMKEYIEGLLYYGGLAEKRSVEKRMEFLESLKNKSRAKKVREESQRLLEMWKDSSLAY